MSSPSTPDTAGASRGAGALLIGCAVASIGLLLAHPGGGASHVLADVLRDEAAHQLPDAIVHGGFVLVLSLELIGLAALAVRADARRTWVIAAMVLALVGAGLTSASMIADGLIMPSIAARYVAAPAERQEGARALLIALGAAIGALMPMGLGFQGLSALAWGAALVRRTGRVRIGGWIALAAGAVALCAAAIGMASLEAHLLMLAIVALAVWILTAGVLLATWRPR